MEVDLKLPRNDRPGPKPPSWLKPNSPERKGPKRPRKKRPSGILVGDFYKAYDHLLAEHQRCWAHLLRDIRESVARYPKNRTLARWAHRLNRLYRSARASPARSSPENHAIRKRLLLPPTWPFESVGTIGTPDGQRLDVSSAYALPGRTEAPHAYVHETLYALAQLARHQYQRLPTMRQDHFGLHR